MATNSSAAQYALNCDNNIRAMLITDRDEVQISVNEMQFPHGLATKFNNTANGVFANQQAYNETAVATIAVPEDVDTRHTVGLSVTRLSDAKTLLTATCKARFVR